MKHNFRYHKRGKMRREFFPLPPEFSQAEAAEKDLLSFLFVRHPFNRKASKPQTKTVNCNIW